jgi:CHASE2 domain-containing sensor protein
VQSPLAKVLGIGVTIVVLYSFCTALFLAQGLWLSFIPSEVVVIVNGVVLLGVEKYYNQRL